MSDALASVSVVQAAVVTDAGRHWLCGENLGAVGFEGPTFSPVQGIGDLPARCSFVDRLDGRTAFTNYVAGGAFGGAVLDDNDTVTHFQLHGDDGGFGDIYWNLRVALDRDGGVVVTEYGDTTGPIVHNDGRYLVSLSDAGSSSYVRSIRRDAQGRVAALASSPSMAVGFWSESTSGWSSSWNVTSASLNDMAVGAQPDGGERWWFVGNDSYVSYASRGGVPTVVPIPDTGNYLGAWLSPQGTLWAVGEGGQVVRVPTPVDGGPAVIATGPGEREVHDLVVTGNNWFAVGGGGSTWSFDAGTWRYAVGTTTTLIGVLERPDGGFSTLNEQGVLRVGGMNYALDASVDGEDRGGLQRGPDGRIWASLGNKLGDYGPNAQWNVRALSSTGFSHSSSVAVDSSGVVWVGMNAKGSSYEYFDGGVAYFNPADGGLGAFPLGMRVFSVTPSGAGVLVGGFYGSFQCTLSGCGPMDPWPEILEVVSVWVDGAQRVWLLDRNGVVRWRESSTATWLTDVVPWSRGSDVDPVPLRIKGNATHVFVVGGWGAIISRPLP